MLPLPHKIAFLLFAALTSTWGVLGFYRVFCRIRRGRSDPEPRFNRLPQRVAQAIAITLSQSRTFKKRVVVSTFHAFIFYGFTFYLLVNLIDALQGFFPIQVTHPVYRSLADTLSFLVLLGVLALVIRRFALPGRRDFRFNPRTLLHPKVRHGLISQDSIIVSTFILFHVSSRAVGAAARLALEGGTSAEPFAGLLSHAIPPAHAEAVRIFGFWGSLGSILAFLAYFPYTKHIHIFMATLKYTVARQARSGVIPPLDITLEETAGPSAIPARTFGAKHLEDLAWPRLLDAYACIQCNRCQDVCPASVTGKSLSPAALEINKRLELNTLARTAFDTGASSPRPLLQFALSPEAAWACTTCGACIDVCPVGDEQMLDIIDIRRDQVMMEGDFPSHLQTAFRGMERAQNPWGINHAKRMDWAAGLNVPTTETNPSPDVLYWVGCAASYDPSAQKTARAFVQLLDHAGVDFAVLGKAECCTGDSARRAGNEYLYRQLADANVSTLNTLAPKLIVASCPHCMNSIGNEYKQIGGDFKVIHHTEYLETLVAAGKLTAEPASTRITYHDPCYLGRHNGVYDAPRNLLNILSNDFVEVPRNRENAFCCGAGGAQFWKEEESGDERISDNRFREAQTTLASSDGIGATLAVGCPFCKSMLSSTPLRASADNIAVKDIAELLLEGVLKAKGTDSKPVCADPTGTAEAVTYVTSQLPASLPPIASTMPPTATTQGVAAASQPSDVSALQPTQKSWKPSLTVAETASAATAMPQPVHEPPQTGLEPAPPAERKKWQPKSAASPAVTPAPEPIAGKAEGEVTDAPAARKKWTPKKPG